MTPAFSGGFAGRQLASTALAAVIALAIGPVAAHAQTYGQLLDSEIPLSTQTGRNQGVNERSRPELEPQGVPVGGVRVYPEIGVGVGYTSNVLGAESGGEGDFYVAALPKVQLRSDWGRHSLNATASYEGRRFFDTSRKNEDGYLASVSGQLDILQRSSVVGTASIRRIYEDQTAGSFPENGGGSIAIDQKLLLLRGTHFFNRLGLTLSTDYNDLNYQPTVTTTGQELDLDFRDHSVTRVSGRAEYELSPDNAVFGQATYRRTTYDIRNVPNDRTSDEWRIGVGAIADITSLIRVAGAVGYFRRTYANPIFAPIGDISVDMRADYYLSPLTTISGVFTRQVEEATVTGSSGYLSTRTGLRIDHELMRNLIPYAFVDRFSEDYKGIDRKDQRWRIGVGAQYRPSRSWRVDFDLGYFTRDSKGERRGPNINELRSLITLKYQL